MQEVKREASLARTWAHKNFGADRLDFLLDDQCWKEVFSKPGRLASCLKPKYYFAVRVSIATVWLACIIWSMISWVTVDRFEYKYWWIKLTHWGAMFDLVYFVCAATTTGLAIWSKIPDGAGEKTPWFVSVTWFLGPTAVVVAFMVFGMYWGLVFKPRPGKPTPIQVTMHGGNFALALTDVLINRQPFYIAHVWVPMCFSLVYGLFTYVYYICGGTFEDGKSPYIYKAINWEKPTTGHLMGMVVLLATPLTYIIFFLVAAKVQHCQASKDRAKDSETAPMIEPQAA